MVDDVLPRCSHRNIHSRFQPAGRRPPRCARPSAAHRGTPTTFSRFHHSKAHKPHHSNAHERHLMTKQILSTLSLTLPPLLLSTVPPGPAAVLGVPACGTNANSPSAAKKTDASLPVAHSEGGKTLDPAEANDGTSDTLVIAAYDQLVT